MCEIEITHVTGMDTPLSSIVVLGSVERCQPTLEGESIKVQLSCPSETVAARDPAGEFQGIFVDANEIVFVDRTNWYALFSRTSISDCRCNGQVFVKAECLSDPDCEATFEVEALQCVECPDVFLEEDIFTRKECNADGTATATFSRTVENNTANDVIVEFFPGHPEAELDPPNQDTSFTVVRTDSRFLTVSFKYPTLSSPTPYIVIRDIQGNILGCPPVPIDIGSMPACCQDIMIDDIDTEDCRVTITMDPILLPEGCEYRWEWGDGTVDSSDIINDDFREGKRNHFYEKKKVHDPYTIRVSAVCGEEDPCITRATTEVELEGCIIENGDDGCAWYNIFCWSICAWLGVVLANAIIAYLVLIATGADPGISAVLANIPGFPTIELNTLYKVLGGLLFVTGSLYATFCGLCNLGKATLAGAVAGLVVIIVAMIFGGSLPDWPEAVFTAVIMGISAVVTIRARCD
jgi:hypothetical protein